MRLRVLTVTASDARDPRYPVGDMCFGGGAWWSTIVRDVLEEVDEEIIVFLEISSLVVFDAAAALADELAASDAAAIAARVLDSRGITIVFDRGRFSPIAHRDSDHRGFVATSVPLRQRPTLFFDGRAFAARRSTLLEVGPPDEELQDQLGDVDWCWRLWLAGRHVITSGSVSVLEHAAAADATRGAAASMQRARPHPRRAAPDGRGARAGQSRACVRALGSDRRQPIAAESATSARGRAARANWPSGAARRGCGRASCMHVASARSRKRRLRARARRPSRW